MIKLFTITLFFILIQNNYAGSFYGDETALMYSTSDGVKETNHYYHKMKKSEKKNDLMAICASMQGEFIELKKGTDLKITDAIISKEKVIFPIRYPFMFKGYDKYFLTDYIISCTGEVDCVMGKGKLFMECEYTYHLVVIDKAAKMFQIVDKNFQVDTKKIMPHPKIEKEESDVSVKV